MRISDWSSDVCSSDLPGNEQGDDEGGNVDDAARVRAVGEIRRYDYPKRAVEQADEIARPADRDRRGRHRIFEDQRPADHPGEQLAHDRISVGVDRKSTRLNSSH